MLIFFQPRSPNGTSKNMTMKYISCGFDNNVFLSASTLQVDDFLLHEENPRFFYQEKIPGTSLTVFMGTSKPHYYLAVDEEHRKLYLQNVPNFHDFIKW